MKDISTLAQDIYDVLDQTKDHEHDAELAAKSAMMVAGEFAKATVKRDKPREKGKLWASDIGKPCMRQHFYNFNHPEEQEQIKGHTKFKFLYGNILEEAVLYYAQEAGHTVEGQQAPVKTTIDDWEVSGRIDAVIDEVLVDVKSTSPYGYKNYVGDPQGLHHGNDSFGYLYQLGYYKEFGSDSLPPYGSEAGFVWIDKQNGNIAYREVKTPDKSDITARVRSIARAVDGSELSAGKAYGPEPYGKSGNQKLPVGCSYCPFKFRCWRDSNGGAGLKGYAYSHGPVWFTDIARPISSKVPPIVVENSNVKTDS